MTYNFSQQLVEGEQGESQLDEFFCRWYYIESASAQMQRSGIDRVFIRRIDGIRSKIEYKTDWTASKTGNAFVETISVDTTGKPGWAFTSQADILIYYLPSDMLIYILDFAKLRLS